MNKSNHFVLAPQDATPTTDMSWLPETMSMLMNEDGDSDSASQSASSFVPPQRSSQQLRQCTNEAPHARTRPYRKRGSDCLTVEHDGGCGGGGPGSRPEEDDLLAFERMMNLFAAAGGGAGVSVGVGVGQQSLPDAAQQQSSANNFADGMLMFTGPEVFDFDGDGVGKAQLKEGKQQQVKGCSQSQAKRLSVHDDKGAKVQETTPLHPSPIYSSNEAAAVTSPASPSAPSPSAEPAHSTPAAPPKSDPDFEAKARIQFEIEAQAERVRLSFVEKKNKKGPGVKSQAAAAEMANTLKKRRTSSILSTGSVPSSLLEEELFSPGTDEDSEEQQQQHGSKKKRNSFVKRRTDGRLIFQSGLRNYFRRCSAASESDIDGSGSSSCATTADISRSSIGSSSSSSCVARRSSAAARVPSQPPSSSPPSSPRSPPTDAAAGRRTHEKRGSVSEIISPMSALLSNAQRASPESITLNGPPHAINVTKNDVVCSSSGRCVMDALIGNRRFQVFVDLHTKRYAKALDERERTEVARSVVNTVRSGVPSGRFLKFDEKRELWAEVGDEEGAVEHAERALRVAAGPILQGLSPLILKLTEEGKKKTASRRELLKRAGSGRAMAA